MPEQDVNQAASKFISSLVKSLQILCNGQVEFAESIELVGHINVRVDHKYKFDYIVDEQVSKEGEDSSTTFLSNSYHSSPPTKQKNRKISPSQLEQDVMFTEIPQGFHRRNVQTDSEFQLSAQSEDNRTSELSRACDENKQGYSVTVSSPRAGSSESSQVVVKLEKGDDSNDCMVLPASPDDYEATGDASGESFPDAGPSSSYEDTHGSHPGRSRKRRKPHEQGISTDGNNTEVSSKREIPSGMLLRSATEKLISTGTNTESPKDNSNTNSDSAKSAEQTSPIGELKLLLSKLATLCDMTLVQDELLMLGAKSSVIPSDEEIKSIKKKFLESFDREKLKKMKEVLKMKKGKQKKQRLRSLLAESGLSNEQLLLLAQDTGVKRKRINWRTMPEGPGKDAMLKEHRKALRLKTQERQRKLLEMAEMLKRNQANDPGFTVISKNGGKKCVLHKSSISLVSHNTQHLSLENIDEVAEVLSGKLKKTGMVLPVDQDKSKEQIKMEYNRRTCLKKKMKQLVGKMLTEVSEAGYRVVVTSTIGSEVGSHSAELSVVPIKIDDFLPETKESDMKPELTEDEYAKQLEREQILEQQQANEDKMKEIELKLLRILTGAEEIFIPTRKRYGKDEPRPTDAERMKEYRKKLKEDPEKYQVYKQKRAMSKKRRRLGELAAKVKVRASGSAVTVIPAVPVSEEAHGSQSIGTLVSITQPVGSVNMHCPQVYEHPNTHQPAVSVVNVHHNSQYVGQVSGIHGTHQHQQPIAYSNDMDIVELIAATHSVQNQHFG